MSDSSYYLYLDPIIDTEEDVLAIRKKAIELYRKGIFEMEWTVEGNGGKKQFVAPVESILRETRYCLKQMNPAKYGTIVRQSGMIRIR